MAAGAEELATAADRHHGTAMIAASSVAAGARERLRVFAVASWPRLPAAAVSRAAPQLRGHTFGGRFSYGVLSTMVVRVDTLAADRISCSRSSSSAGDPTRTLSM